MTNKNGRYKACCFSTSTLIFTTHSNTNPLLSTKTNRIIPNPTTTSTMKVILLAVGLASIIGMLLTCSSIITDSSGVLSSPAMSSNKDILRRDDNAVPPIPPAKKCLPEYSTCKRNNDCCSCWCYDNPRKFSSVVTENLPTQIVWGKMCGGTHHDPVEGCKIQPEPGKGKSTTSQSTTCCC